MYDIREKFPLLTSNSNLVYLDTASTSQKPDVVINSLSNYYLKYNANTGRAPYKLSDESTNIVNETREKVKRLINARSNKEVVFTSGTTLSLNIIAMCYGMYNIKEGDEIVLAISEHHSNIIPWQQVASANKAVIKYIYFEDGYKLSKKDIENKITINTKIVCVAHISNALGIINPIEDIITKAKSVGARVVIDSAQSIAHRTIDVFNLDIDFLVFSGHKMYGPMGIGVLYGKEELLSTMKPHVYGGGMVQHVEKYCTSFLDIPQKFEGGTMNVASIYGLGVAIDFINTIGYQTIIEHERELFEYAVSSLKKLDFIKLLINEDISNHSSALSFIVEDIHPHDIGSILDTKDICIRPGKHCCHPLMDYLGVNATCRISFGIYNNKTDIDRLIEGLHLAKELFDNGSK